MLHATQHVATEWAYTSGRIFAEPFDEVELDVLVTEPDGAERRVPAFWAGDQSWRVRYAPRVPGRHRYRTASNAPELDGQAGELEVAPYAGTSKLLWRGPLRVSRSRRHLEHADGRPFFWLGDTWWMGLTERLSWPDGFELLLTDRQAKGFSVVQIVAGLYPDMPWRDERGANEAGFPWSKRFERIEPAYWDQADLKIQAIVRAGLVPCIVGAWGYFVGWLGVERMKQHWRHLVARYGAYPVVWCLAGEATMPYYLSETKEADREAQRRDWTALGRYLREVDPYRHPITIHPTVWGREQVEDPGVLDLDMLQTGHGDREALPRTLETVTRARHAEPPMPVIDGEVCYEGILEMSRQEVQRLMFWACVLSGAAGHTYGANGIWQVNRRDRPYGPSPHGFSWGDTPWEEAMRLPGSAQVALGKQLLERLEWWRLEPHPEWIEPHWTAGDYLKPYAAGIEGELALAYFPGGPGGVAWLGEGFRLVGLRSPRRAFFFDPTSGREYPTSVDEAGRIAPPPIMQDWVLVAEA